jgi:hypothetical protein
MPELVNPVQQLQMIIESRLSSVFRFCLGADQRLKNRRHESLGISVSPRQNSSLPLHLGRTPRRRCGESRSR